jgi:osmotically-inducible protein OsmY
MNLVKYTRLLLLLGLIAHLSGCAVAAIGGVAAAGTVAADRRTTGTVVEDQAIEVKAIQLINKETDLKEQAHINVTSYNRVVLLSGETPTDAMREKTLRLVKSVEKVTHVYNELTIAAPSSLGSRSSDSYITSKVKTKLLTSEVNAIQFKVVTEKGVVYLMGLVSRAEAQIATDIASQTAGVQKVVKLFQYND